jgi:hypothetical protein
MKKIVVYLPGVKLGYRDLRNADFITQIESNYNVSWVFPNSIPLDFSSKSNITSIKITSVRHYIWTLLFELSNYSYNRKILNAKQSFPFLGLSIKQIAILKVIYYTKTINVFKKIFEYFLDSTFKKYNLLINNEVEAIVCFTSSKDLVFDDLVRNAYNTKSKVILVCINWDNATSKPFIKKPDYMFTWGEQTSSIAESLHKINSIPVGCPRYEHYKYDLEIDLGRYETLNELKENYICILFAGVGFPFPEIEVLNKLAEILEKNKLYNFRIIYRPHPFAWKRDGIQESFYFKKYVIFDPTLTLFEKDDLVQYQFLFKVCKGVITAYSTILVEALMNNLPLLLIAFTHDNNFDWQNAARFAPHLEILKHSNDIIKCNDFENLESEFLEIINKISVSNTSFSSLDLSKKIVLQNHLSYFENFKLQLNKLL